jgi:hypothetical protein
MLTRSGSAEIEIGIEVVHAGFKPEYDMVWVIVGTNEEREIVVNGMERPQQKVDDMGRKMVGVPVNIPLNL